MFFENTNKTLLPAVHDQDLRGGTKVGFIGMTLEDTPNIVTKSGVEGLTFKDEIEHRQRAGAGAQASAAPQSIVVLLHEGGFPADPTRVQRVPGDLRPDRRHQRRAQPGDRRDHLRPHPPGLQLHLQDPPGEPRLVTSASSFGRLVTEVRLSIDNATGDVDRLNTTANNHIVTQDVPKDARTTPLITQVQTLVAPIANKVIGHLTTPSVVRTAGRLGGVPARQPDRRRRSSPTRPP